MFIKSVKVDKMNEKENVILRCLANNNNGKMTQRKLAQTTSFSLGTVNKSLSILEKMGYLKKDLTLNFKKVPFQKPKRAIILAAGYGMRMVPLNVEFPKGLIEVKGEFLIERLINQLHEVGIKDITIVVGFMKERYEYLIDKYGVKMIVNNHYSDMNNLYSLSLACRNSGLSNTYVIPCDIYAKLNPFSKYELESWYMVSKEKVYNTNITLNKKLQLKKVKKGNLGNRMIGIAYLDEQDGNILTTKLRNYVEQPKNNGEYWEIILENSEGYIVNGLLVPPDLITEINTYEELRELDENSNQLDNKIIKLISSVLCVDNKEISQIKLLKKGMTNRSFKFTCQSKRYIMRIPGKGTGELISREKEAKVYHLLSQHNIGEKVLYINADNGYKLSEFIEGARNCNSNSQEDLTKCMNYLRKFHHLGLKVDFTFDLFEKINFYEGLRQGTSNYRDYSLIKARIMKLKEYIESLNKKVVLCHIDANADNFLLKKNGDIVLIDWEYAAMQDPDVDIAMFAIYSMYERDQLDNLIDTYYKGNCPDDTRLKIYAYVAVCGLLWSNWCEYKNTLGVDFGEYSFMQYRYAKEYSKLVLDVLEKKNA